MSGLHGTPPQDLRKAEERRYPQFDALRAFAVACVLFHHWVWPVFSKFDTWYFAPFKVRLGGLGVTIFFVLSGLLITEILSKGQRLPAPEKWQFIKAFYIRRSLRIFPIYILVIAFFAIAVGGIYRENVWWFATYTANIRMFMLQDHLAAATHLWTLAVEEQFYLVVPLLVVFFGSRFRAFAVGLVATAAVVKLATLIMYPEMKYVETLPIISMQALAVGGLLSFRDGAAKVIERAGLPLAALLLIALPMQMAGAEKGALQETLASYGAIGASIWLVTKARDGFKGWFGTVLGWKFLAHLGVISYGIYLYHNFAPLMLRKALSFGGVEFQAMSIVIQVGLLVTSTLLVAQLSWVLIERPINNFKRHFPYLPKAQQKPAPALA